MPEKKKNIWLLSSLGCAIAGTSCGIPFIPGIRGSRLPGIAYPRFVLGSNESGQELHIPARDLLRKGQTDSIPFSKVNMQWGFRKLGDQDILVSACSGDKKFFVGKHIWDTNYFLHNGKKFSSSFKENCCCSGEANGENGKDKSITLTSDFKKKNNGTSDSGTNGSSTTEISKLILLVNTCKFQVTHQDNRSLGKQNLTMECEGYTNSEQGGAGNSSEQTKISLILSDINYKPRYIQKLNNTTQS